MRVPAAPTGAVGGLLGAGSGPGPNGLRPRPVARARELPKNRQKVWSAGQIGFYDAGVPGSEGHAGHEANR
jgi:hypothetical protein